MNRENIVSESALASLCGTAFRLRRLLAFPLFFASVLSHLSCGGGSPSASPPPPPQVSVRVAPKTAIMQAGQVPGQVFSASVVGSSDQTVTWSVQEGAGGGTVSASGNNAI